jgi:hypothetical protein
MRVTVNGNWNCTLLALLVSAATACTPALRQPRPAGSPIDTGAGTVAAARKFLQGRWGLESFEIHPPGAAPIALKGSGTLLYDEFGNLKMDIRADRTSSELLQLVGVDIRDGVISTDGRAVIDMQNRTLTYIIKQQPPLVRGPLSIDRPRHWEISGDILTLTTTDEAGRTLSVARWRRGQRHTGDD